MSLQIFPLIIFIIASFHYQTPFYFLTYTFELFRLAERRFVYVWDYPLANNISVLVRPPYPIFSFLCVQTVQYTFYHSQRRLQHRIIDRLLPMRRMTSD